MAYRLGFYSIIHTMLSKLTLKIGSLNIGGNAKSKCESDDIQRLINQHDIFILLESWLGPDDACPKIASYSNFRNERKKHRRANRHSGGILIFFRQNISGGISKISARSSSLGDVMWLKLSKQYFGMEYDLYLCAAYICPEKHGVINEEHDILSEEIGLYSSQGKVAIIGDLNSRVGVKIENHYDVTPDFINNVAIRRMPVPARTSEDRHCNGHGRRLLQLMSKNDLLLANGRVCGDLRGSLTSWQWNGEAVNDMLIVHKDLIHKLNYFRVGPQDWYSDHAHINFSLKVQIQKRGQTSKGWFQQIGSKQIWDLEQKTRFVDLLSCVAVKQKLEEFCCTQFTDSNKAAEAFTSILQETIQEVFPTKRRRHSQRPRKKVHYSAECQIAKQALKQAQRRLHDDKGNLDRRQEFIRERRKYRKILSVTIKTMKETKIHKLADIENSDPKMFWKTLKGMIVPQDNSVELIDKDSWSQHS